MKSLNYIVVAGLMIGQAIANPTKIQSLKTIVEKSEILAPLYAPTFQRLEQGQWDNRLRTAIENSLETNIQDWNRRTESPDFTEADNDALISDVMSCNRMIEKILNFTNVRPVKWPAGTLEDKMARFISLNFQMGKVTSDDLENALVVDVRNAMSRSVCVQASATITLKALDEYVDRVMPESKQTLPAAGLVDETEDGMDYEFTKNNARTLLNRLGYLEDVLSTNIIPEKLKVNPWMINSPFLDLLGLEEAEQSLEVKLASFVYLLNQRNGGINLAVLENELACDLMRGMSKDQSKATIKLEDLNEYVERTLGNHHTPFTAGFVDETEDGLSYEVKPYNARALLCGLGYLEEDL